VDRSMHGMVMDTVMIVVRTSVRAVLIACRLLLLAGCALLRSLSPSTR